LITIKYKKTYPANLLPHVDTLRALQRIWRRIGANTNYSQGFNPHMLLYMSPPLTLGLSSLCEYMTVDAETDCDVISKFNANSPQGITAEKVFYTAKNPNTAGKITKGEYEINCLGLGKAVQNFTAGKSYIISYEEKGETVNKDIADRIFSVKPMSDDVVTVILAYGNLNLKADRLLRYWCAEYGLDYNTAEITKKNTFCGDIPTDEYIENLDKKV